MFTQNEINYIEAAALKEKQLALLSSEDLRKTRYDNATTLDGIAKKMKAANKTEDDGR